MENWGSIRRQGDLALCCRQMARPKVFGAARGHRRSSASTSARAKGNALAGIKPQSTAWKAAILTTIPPMQAVDADFRGQKRSLKAHESPIGAKGAEAIFVCAHPGFGSRRARESAAFPC
ncbi:hypothetical protein ROHU_011128 [Labeo rohita]|uniref:Uncharacterized protein n=1 Tax=Labeo rohita TaxID=84645 RepID=A0A498LVA0_LABRO|nr:hypothetical protein ROHU_011128 [Labeo rohita]